MIDRLLVLRLDVVDCEAEARLNGVPIARANAARTCAVVPVHEYTVAGVNQLDLVSEAVEFPVPIPDGPISNFAAGAPVKGFVMFRGLAGEQW